MLRKKYFTFLLAFALFLTSGMAVFAQVAPVRGKVTLKKADGTTVPVPDATIDVFRTDINGKFPSGTTNKNGEFSFAGFPLGAVFVLSVSAPNIRPDIYPDIKGGNENLNLVVEEGKGERLTEEQVRKALTAPGMKQTGELTAAQKKEQAELQKKNEEIIAKNKNIENINAIVTRSITEGNKALEAKNYDVAVAKFDEGINADPDFVSSASVLLNKKASALISRATDKNNETAKGDPTVRTQAMVSIKKDYQDAIEALDKSLLLLKNANETDPKIQKQYTDIKNNDLERRKEAYRLMSRTGADRTKGKEALAAFQEYMDSVTDAKIKADTQTALGELLLDTNEFDLAITEFQKVLAQDQNNVNALAIVGFSLVNVGYVNNDKAKLQEGSNYLQKFAELAPDTNPYKTDAKGLIETLKKENSVTPQKVTKKKQ